MEISGLMLVFFAGVFALFSPCAYPLLPGYILYYLGDRATLKKALLGGIVCTLGLISVFSVFGLMASIMGNLINPIISRLVFVSGIILIIMGTSILTSLRFPTLSFSIKAPGRKGFGGLYLYGIAYGLATFACSAPIFISILLYSIVSGGIFGGVLTFWIYALGMGVPLILTTILMVTTKELILRKVVKALPYFEKVSGAVLIIIGIYLIYYYYTA